MHMAIDLLQDEFSQSKVSDAREVLLFLLNIKPYIREMRFFNHTVLFDS